MHERYFVIFGGPYGGHGAGDTPAEALANAPLPRYGPHTARRRYRLVRAFGRRPFAPPDRNAEPGEADAWVNQDGTVSYTQGLCHLEELEESATHEQIMKNYP